MFTPIHKCYLLNLQILLARSPTDFALFVEEVEHTPQNGQQQDADDEDCDDDATALWWGKEHKLQTALAF